MNICILTARIIKKSEIILTKNNIYIQILLCAPNNKKGILFYNIKCKAIGKLAKNISELYLKGDFIIVEGLIMIDKKNILMKNQKYKTIKSLNILIKKVHPASIIFK